VFCAVDLIELDGDDLRLLCRSSIGKAARDAGAVESKFWRAGAQRGPIGEIVGDRADDLSNPSKR